MAENSAQRPIRQTEHPTLLPSVKLAELVLQVSLRMEYIHFLRSLFFFIALTSSAPDLSLARVLAVQVLTATPRLVNMDRVAVRPVGPNTALQILVWKCPRCGSFMPFPHIGHRCGMPLETDENSDMQESFQKFCKWVPSVKGLAPIELVYFPA